MHPERYWSDIARFSLANVLLPTARARLLLCSGQGQGEAQLRQSSLQQLVHRTSVRRAPPIKPRIGLRQRLCCPTSIMSWVIKCFTLSVYQISGGNPHLRVAECAQCTGTSLWALAHGSLRQSNVVWIWIKLWRGSRGCVICDVRVPATETNRATAHVSQERTKVWTKYLVGSVKKRKQRWTRVAAPVYLVVFCRADYLITSTLPPLHHQF